MNKYVLSSLKLPLPCIFAPITNSAAAGKSAAHPPKVVTRKGGREGGCCRWREREVSSPRKVHSTMGFVLT